MIAYRHQEPNNLSWGAQGAVARRQRPQILLVSMSAFGEPVLSGFCQGRLITPVLNGDVEDGHGIAGPIATVFAVHQDRLTNGILNDGEELGHLGLCKALRAQRNIDQADVVGQTELLFDLPPRFTRSIPSEIDDRADVIAVTKGIEGLALRLAAPIEDTRLDL
jgi:hypothetical protein